MRRGPLIAAAAFVLVAVLGVFLLVFPKMSDVTEAEDQLVEAEDQAQVLRTELERREEVAGAAVETEALIRRLEAQVPPTADLPGMVRLLAQSADQAGVEFFSVAPGAPTADASGGFSLIPTTVSVNGGFFALDEFIWRLEELPRAAKVMNLSMSPGGEEAGDLSMQLTIELYTTDASSGPGSDPAPGESFASVTGA